MRLIGNWSSCRTIQGVIVLVISNRPRATRSADLKLLARLVMVIGLSGVQFRE